MDPQYDVIVIGGGPAGLSAALMLGRCRRRVLVVDSGRYRNERAVHMHGYLTRDCTAPAEIRRIARGELQQYGVELLCDTVREARKEGDAFQVEMIAGGSCSSRKLVLATGVVDHLPAIDGVDQFYGSSIHHCPYCDGWEHRDQPIAAYGKGKSGMALAMSLKTWSPDIVLCTDGASGLNRAARNLLASLEIGLRTERVSRLDGDGGDLQRLVFANGDILERRAMFFTTGQDQSCGLAKSFDVEFTPRGAIKTDRWEKTNVPGLFAVGDCSRNVQWVVVAAAQGAIAAEAINTELQEEDRRAFLAARLPSMGGGG